VIFALLKSLFIIKDLCKACAMLFINKNQLVMIFINKICTDLVRLKIRFLHNAKD
jgi:hypothetical protein